MTDKKKVLVWCDSPLVPTGFGIVAKNLLEGLYDEYDISIVGINHQVTMKYDASKYFLYPTGAQEDPFGVKVLYQALQNDPPDAILLFQDIFHIDRVLPLCRQAAPNAKIISYFPVDGTPFSVAWRKPIVDSDVVITYTKFAKQAILDTFPDLKGTKIHLLDHGIDTEVFKPIPMKEIKKARKERQWTSKFVITNINRFQPRKALPLTLRACALFTKGYKICKCGNWYLKGLDTCDLNNCPKKDVIKTVKGRSDALLYLHANAQEPIMGISGAHTLQSAAINAGYIDKDVEVGPKAKLAINGRDLYVNPLSEEELNTVYNISCVNISTAIGEGFGFSLAEAQATGTPTIAPRNSAIPEVLGEGGHLINNIGHFNLPNDNSHMRPIVDVRGVIEALEVEYQAWIANKKVPVKHQSMVDRVKKDFNWDDKRAFIEDIFSLILET